ncbi:hypothetical protein [Tsukamurella sp. 1534]|uniref:hypothetical protein n=1 Tax=Tsukamurella sp. 1534 TaxID=1151061 RepID=UPI0002DF1E66|nr:hypothetical protein [Tsukamurella sp. 1534]
MRESDWTGDVDSDDDLDEMDPPDPMVTALRWLGMLLLGALAVVVYLLYGA